MPHVTDYEYPTFAQASPCFMEVAKIVRGTSTLNLHHKIHCCYTAVGFAASMVPSDHPPVWAAEEGCEVTFDLAAACEAAAASPPVIGGPDVTDWRNWLRVGAQLLELIVRLIATGRP